jgi:hypothetical protein
MLLARLCALTHDMAHVPFGHTFDKEAQIFERDEWQDPFRVRQVFGPDSDLSKLLRIEYYGSRQPAGWQSFAAVLLNDLEEVHKAKGHDSIARLKYPFVHDLVGNTICADLTVGESEPSAKNVIAMSGRLAVSPSGVDPSCPLRLPAVA